MGIRVNWQPTTETDVASYRLERADNYTAAQPDVPWTTLATIPHVIPGPNWDAETSTFFYLDPTGTGVSFYRLTAIDQAYQESLPSPPFQPAVPVPIPSNVVKLDHNYGSPGALRYQTRSGVPVEGALIRVYRKADFDQGKTDQPLAVSLTDARGNWVNHISVSTGFTYTIQFAKEGLYGPDKTEVIA